MERQCGIFWPLPTWEEHFQRKADESKVVKIEDYGKVLSGIVMDAKHGAPLNTIRLSKEWSNSARRCQQIDIASWRVRECLIEDAWEWAKKKVHILALDWVCDM